MFALLTAAAMRVPISRSSAAVVWGERGPHLDVSYGHDELTHSIAETFRDIHGPAACFTVTADGKPKSDGPCDYCHVTTPAYERQE